jgi:D-alanine transaminase
MAAVAYVNGRYRPIRDAEVNVEDRGYQFGDGIYEVFYVLEHRLVDADLHYFRLERSLREIGILAPLRRAALPLVIGEVIRRNRVKTGLVYLQITRGVAARDHAFPSPSTRPSIVITARHRPAPPRIAESWAVAAITAPDERWARCDIKSINLLPNVLARQAARQAGAYEAILYDADGFVTEGAASTVWMVDMAGVLRTRRLGNQILPGCTRAALMAALSGDGTAYDETPFSLDELRQAREIFLTSATSFVKPVIRLDGTVVGDGTPGPVSKFLLDRYIAHIEAI